jgi:hypothetical protein
MSDWMAGFGGRKALDGNEAVGFARFVSVERLISARNF